MLAFAKLGSNVSACWKASMAPSKSPSFPSAAPRLVNPNASGSSSLARRYSGTALSGALECGPALNACQDEWPKKVVGSSDNELHPVLIPAILGQGILEGDAELRQEVS